MLTIVDDWIYLDGVKTHFKKSEVSCSCGCGFMPPERYMRRIEGLRIVCDFLFPVSGPARCSKYNQEVSGSGPRGPHTKGALDLRLRGEQAFIVVTQCANFGFTGIGVSQKSGSDDWFIHLDDVERNDPDSPRPWIWSY